MTHRVLLVILLLVPAATAHIGAQSPARQVLILNSFERGSTENVFAGMLRTELGRTLAEPINFFEVSLQPALSPENPREGPAVDYLRNTFGNQHIDLVVTLGGPAAGFAQKYRDTLFATRPLLFAAMDEVWVRGKKLSSNETALATTTDIPMLLKNIQQVLPATTTVFVVIGASRVEKFWRSEMERAFLPFAKNIRFIWSDNLSFSDTVKRASSLPAHSAILYVLYSIDATGVSQAEERTLAELRAAANAPIFGLYDLQLGRGIVGGSLIAVDELAKTTGAVAERILRGESPSAIKVAPGGHGAPIYDWRELQRWRISEAALPPGSTIQFRQPGLWEQYQAYFVVGAMIFALQTALIGALAVQRARRRRSEVALRHSEHQLRESFDQNRDLAGRLINAQESERMRIARDLHDDVSQQVAGLAIMMSAAKRQVAKHDAQAEGLQTIGTMQERAARLAETIRTMSHELHPGVLQLAGLVTTLQRHCAEIAKLHSIEISFVAPDEMVRPNDDVALCLFRVAQEALSNTVRHARAKSAHVRLSEIEGYVSLDIVDDGVGFLADQIRRGLGLRSIDERVRLCGGEVTMASRPGAGTTINVRVPTAIASIANQPVPASS